MFFKFLKASRERVDFKILPIDGAKVCKPIGLDRRQLGLVREEGQFVDIGNMRKKGIFYEPIGASQEVATVAQGLNSCDLSSSQKPS